MDDLVTWLRAQLDEDERVALATTPGHEKWQAFPMEDIAGCSVYDDQWLLLSGKWYTHNEPMSSDPTRTGPAYINTDRVMEHIARHDPARVLADVAAKRALLTQFELRGRSVRAVVKPETGGVWDDLLRMLAAVYADRPGYREEWRP